MKVLILGGSSFVGRAIAVEAVARSHEVTLLNRGTHSGPAGTKTLVGDRLESDGLRALEGLSFDAVVDTWMGDPAAITRAIDALKGRIGHFTYISSAAIYDPAVLDSASKLYDEGTKVFDVTAPGATDKVYPYNKRQGEIEVERGVRDAQGKPALLLRPSIIIGPHEHPDIIELGRLTWWLHRLEKGGRTLAPGPRDLAMQLVDARDLARFTIDAIEAGLDGEYNIAGDPGNCTMEQLLELGAELTGGTAELVWKSPKEILDAKIIPGKDLPFWMDPESRTFIMFYRWDIGKASKAGFKRRPIEETIRDTWTWMKDDPNIKPAPDDYKSPMMGLSPEKEAKLLG
ncbi:NAD-dependent protein [Xylariales sp. PMI_506]|nr:NAD-dependent protein [Xylariales sp. PMI_506]